MAVDHSSHDRLERSLDEIDWAALRRPGYQASPAAWEDQVRYFLMLDRYSDGREQGCRDPAGNPVAAGSTPPFRFPDDAYRADWAAWAEAGDEWLGGTRQDLVDLVEAAHGLGIRVILDIILNHAGDVFGYRADRYLTEDGQGGRYLDPRWDGAAYPVAGWREPADYFGLFRNSEQERKPSHIWFGKHVVTLFDDHDQVRKGNDKARFCGDKANQGYRHLKAALGLNLCSMGIPCLYYGTEQGFDGAGGNDRYLRECMFGGAFGSLQSRDLVPWSRLFDNRETPLAINTDADAAHSAWATVDADLHAGAGELACLYSSEPAASSPTPAVKPVTAAIYS